MAFKKSVPINFKVTPEQHQRITAAAEKKAVAVASKARELLLIWVDSVEREQD
jgi:hypothetical protein